MRPKLLLLDEPTEGIQPSIIKDIGRAISYLRDLGNIAIVLVEQYLDFARELGDHFAVWTAARSSSPATAATSIRRRSAGRWRFSLAVAASLRLRRGIVRREWAIRRGIERNPCGSSDRFRRQSGGRLGRARRPQYDGVTRRSTVHEAGSLRVRFPSPEPTRFRPC